MTGTNALTGRPLSGIDHLIQSVTDILLTPKGSRVMLRDYGSDLFSLVDRPLNAKTEMDIYAATVGALVDWEPRIRVDQVTVSAAESPGHFEIDLSGTYLPDGTAVKLEGIVI